MAENGAEAQTGAGERVAIGITFGNSNSSIAYTIDDKPEVMANEDGGKCNTCVSKHRSMLILIIADRQIPTILSYVDGEEYYGGQAKAFLVRNPNNTVAYFKEFLGKEWVCPLIQRRGDLFPPNVADTPIASSPSTLPTTTPPPTPKSLAQPSPSP